MIDILTKIKQEEDLLNDWANNIPGFIRDGVVNPEHYYNQPFKISAPNSIYAGGVSALRKILCKKESKQIRK